MAKFEGIWRKNSTENTYIKSSKPRPVRYRWHFVFIGINCCNGVKLPFLYRQDKMQDNLNWIPVWKEVKFRVSQVIHQCSLIISLLFLSQLSVYIQSAICKRITNLQFLYFLHNSLLFNTIIWSLCIAKWICIWNRKSTKIFPGFQIPGMSLIVHSSTYHTALRIAYYWSIQIVDTPYNFSTKMF
jgi:hypothetical protein